MAHTVADMFGRVTTAERSARGGMLASIKLAYLSGARGDDEIGEAIARFDGAANEDTPLSVVFRMLSSAQRRRLRTSIENPAVRMLERDGSEPDLEARLDLLGRLERRERVGSVSETQISRPKGTKVF